MSSVRPIVLDAGSLISAESRSRVIWTVYDETLITGQELIVSTPVLAQVWRNGRKQAVIGRFLRRCVVDAPNESTAKRAGELLGRTGTSDAVDALVVATAIERGATTILTSDPNDLKALVDASGVKLPPLVQKV
ncbi:PIN domain-containing protein [Actinoallomurus sp. NBC_01490]|jgi:predicted nucleic acid-binding protein|uniref:type II toxin-antitoxin system VapC family toxin n=1 Tax=Actinoallomurus sp. NBC_01490 TaxID=2903557 RepID=UPI002E35DE0C|nr:PIN domain-containing protein [Actinoallomurus sp. NBC_01490]